MTSRPADTGTVWASFPPLPPPIPETPVVETSFARTSLGHSSETSSVQAPLPQARSHDVPSFEVRSLGRRPHLSPSVGPGSESFTVIAVTDAAPTISPRLPDRVVARPAAAAGRRGVGVPSAPKGRVQDHPFGTPPPSLVPTTWLRLLLVALLLTSIAAVLWTQYRGTFDEASTAQLIVGVHAAALGALIVWSFAAIDNADAVVPASRYRPRPRGWVAASLWLVAIAAPIGGAAVWEASGDWADPRDDLELFLIRAGVVVAVAALMWLPFRYLANQARHIGAVRRAVITWYWLPLLCVGGGALIMRFGLRDDLAVDGITDVERLIDVGVVYGLATVLFTLTAWRATQQFDETVHRRWTRRRNEWEQRVAGFDIDPATGRSRT